MRNEVTVAGRDSMMRSFITCTPSQALHKWQNQCGRGRQHVWESEVLHSRFWGEGWTWWKETTGWWWQDNGLKK